MFKRWCKFRYHPTNVPPDLLQYHCKHPQNEWDGLCGVESCERCGIIRILFFGTTEILFRKELGKLIKINKTI